MTLRNRVRPALLASALGFGLLPLIGCIGASDDKEGSGLKAGTGGSIVNGGDGIDTNTQKARDDKGDTASIGTGTERPDPAHIDAAKTGGLGGTRNNQPVGPGETGARNDSPPTPPEQPAPKSN